MKASELRLGNFVEYNGMTLRVSEIYSPKPRLPKEFSDVECIELHCDGFIAATIDQIKPVELTEELLLKYGFYHRGSGFYVFDINDWSNIQIHFYKKDCVAEISVSKHSFVLKCSNLHQLQNLYHALTGKELI